MHVTSKYGDPNAKVFGELLQSQDEFPTLTLVCAGGVMVVEVIQKINAPVELVEEVASESKTLVEKFDWRNYGRSENVFQPSQPWIGNRYTKQEDQVLD